MKTQLGLGWLALTALLLCAGCASLQSVSMTTIPRGAERAHPIKATESNAAFLGIHFDNHFADGVPDDLRRQCPNGKVTGIYAKYETKWYVLVEDRSVTAEAYCVPGEIARAPVNAPPASTMPNAPGVAPAAPSSLPPPPAPSSLPAAPAPAASLRATPHGGSS